ncbi:MAG TPA: PilZ domain-containing protein [Devosia sp.]|nr:PilZ domain-containing protein [Devosia sp.]
MNERRALPREAVHLEATIVTAGGVIRFGGAVLNMTAMGARVDVPPNHELPNRFYMLMPDHRMQPCRIVWRDGIHVGLQFES